LSKAIQHIAKDVAATFELKRPASIHYLLTDSRKLVDPQKALYFALTTTQNDGHKYIADLAAKGVYNFVVRESFDTTDYPNHNFIKVKEVLKALQMIAQVHRSSFNYPVIGIAGSNGKTIVKEWLNDLLSPRFKIVRSPRSYNSQVGVPLSVWEMNEAHTLALFEAGISQQGEMENLERVIQPTIGILTGIGTAHQEGFESQVKKLSEKLLLFKHAEILIGPYEIVSTLPADQKISLPKLFTWGYNSNATLFVQSVQSEGSITHIRALYHGESLNVKVPFTDNASIENIMTCWATLLMMQQPTKMIQEGMMLLRPLDMRMQVRKGINGCAILNDSYSNDIHALQLGLDYAQQQAGELPITLIISDFADRGSTSTEYESLLQKFAAWPLKKIITIGPDLQKRITEKGLVKNRDIKVISFQNTADCIAHLDTTNFRNEFIMIKGARSYELERVSALLEAQVHQTRLEVNLTSLVNNYKKIKTKVGPDVKIMAMVKAFGYGSGSLEVASALQFHHVNYLAVAYADEGVDLRKAGIKLPIMVMNADPTAFDTLVKYHLEPELFSFEIVASFTNYLKTQGIHTFPVHIKLNTGMNRLGFDIEEVSPLCEFLKTNTSLKVQTIFSHLSASGQVAYSAFTNQQLELFTSAALEIEKALGYTIIKHIANSDAVLSDTSFHLDMVRLGIGMYGVQPGPLHFEPVVQFFTTIAQIRTVQTHETVGYNRAGILKRPSTIATVRIGYADGYPRKLGRGVGFMWIQGKLAPTVGDICMDMTMIDVTDIEGVQVGDQVEVFGHHLAVGQLADWAETIPYEILTSIGQRVKRVYLQD